MADARGFALEIEQEFDQVLDEWRKLIEQIALKALSRVVELTPVATGQAKANWFVSFGGAGVEVTTEVDRTGAVTIARGAQVLATYAQQGGFPKIVIYNNLPYIGRLEDGHSRIQAPNGMVAVTLAELQAEI